MEKIYLVALIGVLGAHDNVKDAQDASVKILEKFPLYRDIFLVTKPADLCEEFTEVQMRSLRQVLAKAAGAETQFEKLRKEQQAEGLFADIVASVESGSYKNVPRPSAEAGDTARPPADPPKGKTSKGLPARFPGGAKGYIRSKFPNVGDVVEKDVLFDCPYNEAGVTTAISDLKSPKYCGTEGLLVVKRSKREDGVVIFTRES